MQANIIKLLRIPFANLSYFSSPDGVSTKMHQNNVFTVAKRNLEGQDMVYQAIKFTNNVWALTELKIQPGNPIITVSLLFKPVRIVSRLYYDLA